MNHVIGLGVEQALVDTSSDHYTWPQGAGASNPSSWGAASLGDLPQISAVTPTSALVGSGDTTITIDGSGFASGATARVNGVVIATTVVNATQVQATIPAVNLAAAATLKLTVANPGLDAAPSNGLPFSVTNPLPQITQATLAGKTLTITGNNFAPGATVQFNGNDYLTTGSATQRTITLNDDDVIGSARAPVSAFNPGPGGGVSNVVMLVAGRSGVFLPLISGG